MRLTELEKSRLTQPYSDGKVRYVQYVARQKLSEWIASAEDVQFILNSNIPKPSKAFGKIVSIKSIISIMDTLTALIESIHIPTIVQGEFVITGKNKEQGFSLRKATDEEKRSIRALNKSIDRLTRALLSLSEIPKEEIE